MIVSRDASSKFQKRRFQNERFAGGVLKISCEASSKFHKTKFQNDRFVRGFFKFSQNNGFQNTIAQKPRTMRRAIIPRAQSHSFVRSTHRILREGSSIKIKMCVSLQRHAIQNFQMRLSLQRRVQKCMNPAHDVRGNPPHTKITILPTVSDVRPARSDERVAPASSN